MTYGRNPLSLDMGWKLTVNTLIRDSLTRRNPLSLDMGWKKTEHCRLMASLAGRNPLSLDMGWKCGKVQLYAKKLGKSQSAFAGYGLEELHC